jgi:malectin (di-glucose binding ER protein)
MILDSPAQEMSPAERSELDWLLESGVLGRSANAARVLRYICEESAAGRADRLKEYTIAVEALGRRADFNPQHDTIVRVTVHTLRKRLQEVYSHGEGATHNVRLVIPSGGYAVHFASVDSKPSSEIGLSATGASVDLSVSAARTPERPKQLGSSSTHDYRRSFWLILMLAGAFLVFVVFVLRRHVSIGHKEISRSVAAPALTPSGGPVRLMLGPDKHRYSDHAGQSWLPANCDGGTVVAPANAAIGGTEDSYLYQGGLSGMVHCVFPVAKGIYELHLYFAEPTDLEAARRTALISINAGPARGVDVVDRAGGDRLATSISIPGVSPENDGAIHLDYTSEVSPLTAVEIVPAPSVALLPIRIVASSSPYVDEMGQLWLSDRYFSGGRRGQTPDQEHRPNMGLYGADRIGKFRYILPVVPNASYRVRLYFREPWFGQDNGPAGGPGSRVFNVSCNGEMMLRNFDILAESKGAPLVKTLDHVTATTDGTIELFFLPVINYPVVNAIEVEPEDGVSK